jgi:ligand-binding sensor domain-containing protein
MFLSVWVNESKAQLQNSTYTLQSFNVDDGLSEDYIFTLLEDQNGFIWIGTRNGLDRFNGYTFERIDIGQQTQGQEQVRSLIEDREGNIWIGTNNGLFCKEHKTDIISKIELTDEKVEVNCLFQDDSGSIWIGTSNGILFRYVLKDNTVKSYSIPEKTSITDILQEGDDLIVAFRYYGTARLNLNNERFYYSGKDVFFEKHVIETLNKLSSGNFLISTRSGIFLDENDGRFQDIVDYSSGIDELDLKNISTATQINDTSVLLGTDGLGIFNFNPVTKNIRPVNIKSIVPIKSVTSILPSKNGLIWFATTNSGLHVYDPNRSMFEHWGYEKGNPTGLGGNSVLGVSELVNGNIIMALDGGGVNIYDSAQQLFIHSTSPVIDVNNTVIQSKKDKTVWVGTFGNGLRFAKIKNDNQLEIIQKENPIPKNSTIKCIYEDNKGDFWITTHTGLYKGVKDANDRIQIKRSENNLFAHMIYAVFEDANSNFWLGGMNRLLKYLPANDSTVIIYLSSYEYFQITSITQSNKNCVWIGTKIGLFNIDEANKDTIHYTTQNGLPSNSVNSILYDDNGSLWLGTDHGLVQMNIANGTFRQFGKRDGIKGVSFNENSAFKASDGKLYFGSTNGVYSFYPNNIVSNYKAPEIVFTKLELFNKEIKPNDKSGILTKSINQTGTINLNFKQNGISIEFVAINYTNPQKNQYAYFLEGLDKEWMYSNGNRKVVYNNLAPGSYTFKVKASNNDGVWNNTGRELSIIISPPWHKTWLALSFFVLLLLLVVVLINLMCSSNSGYRMR